MAVSRNAFDDADIPAYRVAIKIVPAPVRMKAIVSNELAVSAIIAFPAAPVLSPVVGPPLSLPVRVIGFPLSVLGQCLGGASLLSLPFCAASTIIVFARTAALNMRLSGGFAAALALAFTSAWICKCTACCESGYTSGNHQRTHGSSPRSLNAKEDDLFPDGDATL
ncbi:MAG: hypothetical protein ABWZ75_01925 [Novosphingobium sp.]